MTALEKWKFDLAEEAKKYGLDLNDVVPEDEVIERFIERGWSPKEEMDRQADKNDLVTLDDFINKPYGGY